MPGIKRGKIILIDHFIIHGLCDMVPYWFRCAFGIDIDGHGASRSAYIAKRIGIEITMAPKISANHLGSINTSKTKFLNAMIPIVTTASPAFKGILAEAEKMAVFRSWNIGIFASQHTAHSMPVKQEGA